MIVESAFLKLPELLTSKSDHRATLEATVVNLLGTAVLMELNSRNILRPFDRVHQERVYQGGEGPVSLRADLYVDLEGVFSFPGRMEAYGARRENWIEVKTFFASTRRSDSHPPRTANAGFVLRDLLRICLLPSLGAIGRYLLLVFSGEPAQSVALRRGAKDREWLCALLMEGSSRLRMDISAEPRSFRRSVGPGFESLEELEVDLRFHTMAFEATPDARSGTYPLFQGYLVRVLGFGIRMDGLHVECEDRPGGTQCSDVGTYQALRRAVVGKL